jgi:hypothetical protein
MFDRCYNPVSVLPRAGTVLISLSRLLTKEMNLQHRRIIIIKKTIELPVIIRKKVITKQEAAINSSENKKFWACKYCSLLIFLILMSLVCK